DAIRFNSKLLVEPVIVEHHKLEKVLGQHFAEESSFDFNDEEFDLDVNLDGLTAQEDEEEAPQGDEAPIVKYINKLLIDAIRMGASDLHFEPYEKSYRVRYRVDGMLRQIANPPLQLANRLASRLKVMSQMDISEKRVPQDGRIKLKLSKSKAIDFRVNSLPTLFGEKLVLRILDPSSAMLGIDALGYEEDQKALFMEALDKPQGMLLITGPTGSGKTTTLYSSLKQLATEQVNVCTIEDPIEMLEPSFNQMQVNHAIELGFADGVRALMRQDPDIIMIGEIRDQDTANMAIQAALTGHLVLSTLHTNDAPSSLTRLHDLGVQPFLTAATILGVLAQRLVRKLCPNCKQQTHINEDEWQHLTFDYIMEMPEKVYRAVGCEECRHTGYKGRIGIYEFMPVSLELKHLISSHATLNELRSQTKKESVEPLRIAGARKVLEGLTTLEEVLRVVPLN
ncbi:GspE/PulE family protein, partial [Acinetobacter pittii]|uniref:GspE/PulE family protein n=1 Tax=Acinetobacter pittii TaxID=48296 RepID=UPI00374EE0F2